MEEEFPIVSYTKFHEFLVVAVEDIIAQSSHAMAMLVGSFENHIVSLIIACWRRAVYRWSVVSAMSESRLFLAPVNNNNSGSNLAVAIRDYEQLIEAFDPQAVDVETLAPEWFVMHRNIEVSTLYIVLTM
jgi:hypothetical protein